MVAHVILVSAQGPNPFSFFFGGLLFDLGACWDQDLDQGLTIKKEIDKKCTCTAQFYTNNTSECLLRLSH